MPLTHPHTTAPTIGPPQTQVRITRTTGTRTDELHRTFRIQAAHPVPANGGALLQPTDIHMRWLNGRCEPIEVRGPRLRANGTPSTAVHAGATYARVQDLPGDLADVITAALLADTRLRDYLDHHNRPGPP